MKTERITVQISMAAAEHIAARRAALTVAEAELRAQLNVLLLEHGIEGDVRLVDVKDGALVLDQVVPPEEEEGAD